MVEVLIYAPVPKEPTDVELFEDIYQEVVQSFKGKEENNITWKMTRAFEEKLEEKNIKYYKVGYSLYYVDDRVIEFLKKDLVNKIELLYGINIGYETPKVFVVPSVEVDPPVEDYLTPLAIACFSTVLSVTFGIIHGKKKD